MAKTMFSGSSNPTVIPTILSYLTGSDKSELAAANPEVLISPLVHMIATQFQRLNLPLLCGNVGNGATKLPDLENMAL